MELYLIIAALVLLLVNLIFQLLSPPGKILTGLSARLDQTDKNSDRVENTVREEVKTNRQELSGTLSSFQSSFLYQILRTSKK
jgi:hypothetical protein